MATKRTAPAPVATLTWPAVLAWRLERQHLARHKGAVFRPQGWISPVLLVGGAIRGTWRHERTGKRLLVEITPFAPVDTAIRAAVAVEAEGLRSFLGGDLTVTWAG